MAARTLYWVGGTGTWDTTTTHWSLLSQGFVASCPTPTSLVITSVAPTVNLVAGTKVYNQINGLLGTIVSGSGLTYVISGGAIAGSQLMTAAVTGAAVPTSIDTVIFDGNSFGFLQSSFLNIAGTTTATTLTLTADTHLPAGVAIYDGDGAVLGTITTTGTGTVFALTGGSSSTIRSTLTSLDAAMPYTVTHSIASAVASIIMDGPITFAGTGTLNIASTLGAGLSIGQFRQGSTLPIWNKTGAVTFSGTNVTYDAIINTFLSPIIISGATTVLGGSGWSCSGGWSGGYTGQLLGSYGTANASASSVTLTSGTIDISVYITCTNYTQTTGTNNGLEIRCSSLGGNVTLNGGTLNSSFIYCGAFVMSGATSINSGYTDCSTYVQNAGTSNYFDMTGGIFASGAITHFAGLIDVGLMDCSNYIATGTTAASLNGTNININGNNSTVVAATNPLWTTNSALSASIFNYTYIGAVGTRIITVQSPGGAAVTHSFGSATDIVSITTGSVLSILDLTNFTGTVAGGDFSLDNSYNSITAGWAGTITPPTISPIGWTNTGTITYIGTGSTFQDTLRGIGVGSTMTTTGIITNPIVAQCTGSGSLGFSPLSPCIITTGSFTLISGTVISNNNLVCSSFTITPNALTRYVDFSSGGITVTGGGTSISVPTTSANLVNCSVASGSIINIANSSATLTLSTGTQAPTYNIANNVCSNISCSINPQTFANSRIQAIFNCTSRTLTANTIILNSSNIAVGQIYTTSTSTSFNITPSAGNITGLPGVTTPTQLMTTGTRALVQVPGALGATNMRKLETNSITINTGDNVYYSGHLIGNVTAGGTYTLSIPINVTNIFYALSSVLVDIVSPTYFSGNVVTSFVSTSSITVPVNSAIYDTLGTLVGNITTAGTYVAATLVPVANGITRSAQVLSYTPTATNTVNLVSGHYYGGLYFYNFSGHVPNITSTICGDLLLSPSMVFMSGAQAGANTLTFSDSFNGQMSMITPNGLTIDCPINIKANTMSTISLGSDLIIGSTRNLSLTSGSFYDSGWSINVGSFSSTGTATRSIGFGGTWSIAGTGACWNISGTGITTSFVYAGSNGMSTGHEYTNIVLTDSSTAGRTFAGNSLQYGTVQIGTTPGDATASITTFTGNNSFYSLINNKASGTIKFTAGSTTNTALFQLQGATITSDTTAVHYLVNNSALYVPPISLNYKNDWLCEPITLSYSAASSNPNTVKCFAGATSTFGTSVSGWIHGYPSTGSFFDVF